MQSLPPEVAALLQHGVARANDIRTVTGDPGLALLLDTATLARVPGRLVVHPPSVDRFTPMFEVQLRCPRAVASRALAAWLHGIPPVWGQTPPALTFSCADNTRAGVARIQDLGGEDVTCVAGLRVTSATRTIADLGAVDPDLQEQVGEAFLHRGDTSEGDLRRIVGRLGRQGKPGVAALDIFLRRRGPGTPPCESPLETRALQAIRRLGYPEPSHRQLKIGRLRVDFAWRVANHLVLVEIDGAGTHANPEALVSDLRRQNQLMRTHPTLLRFSADDVDFHPEHLDNELRHHVPHRRCYRPAPNTSRSSAGTTASSWS
jgi:very-short-patch-repair endonuclease